MGYIIFYITKKIESCQCFTNIGSVCNLDLERMRMESSMLNVFFFNEPIKGHSYEIRPPRKK